jgi:hypothetical protein
MFGQRIDAEIRRVENALTAERLRAVARADASDDATQVRTRELETRLTGMNEFRASLNDFANRAATVDQLDTKTNPIRERLDKLEKQAVTFIDLAVVDRRVDPLNMQLSRIENQLARIDGVSSDLGAVQTDIATLKEAKSAQSGRASGVQWVIGFIGFLITVAAFVLGYLALKPRP